MKFNIEVDLEWIDENSNVDETIKNEVVNKITQIIEEKILKDVTNKVAASIKAKADKLVDGVFKRFMMMPIQVTDNWGKVVKEYQDVEEVVKEKFDNYLLEKVDKNGKPTSYSAYTTRFKYLTEELIKKHSEEFTKDTVAKVEAEVKKQLDQKLKDVIGEKVVQVVGLHKLLPSASKK